MSSQSNFDDVGDFHTKFGLISVTEDGAYPRHPTQELLKFRIKFLLEELLEFIDGLGWRLSQGPDGGWILSVPKEQETPDHAQMFDSLIDLVYVAHGTAHLLGYPWQEGWERVQAANMSKVRAQADGSDSKRGSSFDVVKPEGWMPPDIAGLLRECGWGIPEKENTE